MWLLKVEYQIKDLRVDWTREVNCGNQNLSHEDDHILNLTDGGNCRGMNLGL